MELRHLRYFVAVAEEGSLTLAAEKRLFTAQPSLSRQIRDLEFEVGFPLFARSARGVDLTAAGKAFLQHAQIALAEAESAITAARRAAEPEKPVFSIGFLTGQEVDWLPHATRVLRDELPNIEIRVSSQYSPQLADELLRGRIDIGFMRCEPKAELEYRVIASEPLVVILPSDHRLASQDEIDPHDIVGETFIGLSDTAHILRAAIDGYLARQNIQITPTHFIDNFAMGVSLVASTRGVAFLPRYAENFLSWSVVSRPLKGEAPTVDLAVGYNKSNKSPLLKLFLSGLDSMVEGFSKR